MGDQALLVGINAYPGQPLNGCVNDVNDMAHFLVDSCSFAPDDIRLLVDGRATTAAIKERLGWLLANATVGDRLYFHYSGHGALFPIRNGQGDVTAVYDAICPVDFDWSPEHAILSSDFESMFRTLPAGLEFVFVSDSCDSGDLAKGLGPYQSKFFVPPADIVWRLRTAGAKKLKPTKLRDAAHENCAFISGCKSDQESADAVFGGRANGALTYYLLKSLKAANGLTQSLTKLLPSVRHDLRSNGYSQDPQLHGPEAVIHRAFLATAAPKKRASAARAPVRARRGPKK